MSKRFVGEVVELDRSCDLGEKGERAVVTEVDGKYMTLVFPNREYERRINTGADYRFLRSA